MDINNFGTARAEYYDRNPTVVSLSGGVTAAPHALIIRDTYTVPAGKKAFVSSVYLFMDKVTASTPRANSIINIQIDSGVILNTTLAQIKAELPAAEDHEAIDQSYSVLLTAGDTVTIETQDGNTGGSVNYEWSSVIIEFDA